MKLWQKFNEVKIIKCYTHCLLGFPNKSNRRFPTLSKFLPFNLSLPSLTNNNSSCFLQCWAQQPCTKIEKDSHCISGSIPDTLSHPPTPLTWMFPGRYCTHHNWWDSAEKRKKKNINYSQNSQQNIKWEVSNPLCFFIHFTFMWHEPVLDRSYILAGEKHTKFIDKWFILPLLVFPSSVWIQLWPRGHWWLPANTSRSETPSDRPHTLSDCSSHVRIGRISENTIIKIQLLTGKRSSTQYSPRVPATKYMQIEHLGIIIFMYLLMIIAGSWMILFIESEANTVKVFLKGRK